MKLVGCDSETFPIGPGAVIPKLVCYSLSEESLGKALFARVDKGAEETLAALFEDRDTRLVFHNAAFDCPVFCRAWPALRGPIWAKLEAGLISDTMIREMLLNLSTFGSLKTAPMPSGKSRQLGYKLSDLALKHLGLDLSSQKDEDDAPRQNYYLLDGLPSSEYPKEWADYARDDADHPVRIYHAQDALVESQNGRASLATETFHTAVAVALTFITDRGMKVDRPVFDRVAAWVESELHEDNLRPLFQAGLLRRPVPSLPHARQDSAARLLVGQWLGVPPEKVNWASVDEQTRDALRECGIKFKEAEAASKATKEIKRRVLALQVAVRRGTGVESVLVPSNTLEILQEACASESVPFKKTDTGEVCCDKEVVEELALDDPVMEQFKNYAETTSFKSKEMPRMMWQGQPADRVHFPFNVLVETGRTSSRGSDLYPSGNGQNVDPRARGMFIPEPGHVLCSCDYSTLELGCVAQTTFDLFGKSVHRDKINAGYDLHSWLAVGILGMIQESRALAAVPAGISGWHEAAYKWFKAQEGSDPVYYKEWRDLAKPIGLGFPGGLGPWKVIGLAKKDYSVDLLKIAEARFLAHPEEFEPTRKVLYWAERLHGFGKDDFRWTRQLKGIALTDRFREAWLATYPEMVQYFDWVKNQHDAHNWITKVDEDGEETSSGLLCYTTPLGMHRAATTFTEVANGRCMQSPAAEGFKIAIFNLTRAFLDPASKSPLRGNGYVVDEIHDELLTELREHDGKTYIAHDLAMEQKRIQEEAMAMILTDVKVKAEPALMRRWDKLAKPVYQNEKLVPWVPKG